MNDFFTRMAKRSREEAAIVEPRLPGLFGPMEYAVPMEIFEPGTVSSSASQSNGKGIRNAEMIFAVEDQEPPDVQVGYGKKQYSQNEISQPLSAEVRQSTGQVINSNILPVQKLVDGDRQSHSQSAKTIHSDKNNLQKKIDYSTVVTELDKSQQPQLTELQPMLVPDYRPPEFLFREPFAEVPAVMEQNLQQKQAVHINIGRIEVRAQANSPPATIKPIRSKRRKELSSLNDYLKRSGGIS